MNPTILLYIVLKPSQQLSLSTFKLLGAQRRVWCPARWNTYKDNNLVELRWKEQHPNNCRCQETWRDRYKNELCSNLVAFLHEKKTENDTKGFPSLDNFFFFFYFAPDFLWQKHG